MYLTPCWAGKYPLRKVERAGEHIHAFVNAFSNVKPVRCNCASPGNVALDPAAREVLNGSLLVGHKDQDVHPGDVVSVGWPVHPPTHLRRGRGRVSTQQNRWSRHCGRFQ